MESSDLEQRLTNYDVVSRLKEVLKDDEKRFILEGAIVLAAPIYLNEQFHPTTEDIYEPGYKLQAANLIKDTLYGIIKNPENADTIVNELTAKLTGDINTKIILSGKRPESLFVTSLKTADRCKELPRIRHLCYEIGEEIESSFNKLYVNRGLKTEPESRSEDRIRKYMRIEYDYFTRVAHSLSKKELK